MKDVLFRDPYLALLMVVVGAFAKTQEFYQQVLWITVGVIILLIRNRSKIKWAEKENPSSQKDTIKQ